MFYADLHIHSRFSRACSRDCDIEHLAWWALRKGITVVGTGDFTHPAWADELKQTLIPAEAGLLQLRPDLADRLRRTSPPSCGGQVRFMLSAEISTIYRSGERTRKVHHLIYAPTFEAADRITTALSRIGNLASDGRPILGLDSRHLLEITLEGGPGCYLVPAHAWTPWFAVLGSKSGFDLVADCYGDLAAQVFAIETGLSSDPPMNWMCSALDGYRLVSNSDAHSPPMLGREATTFSTGLDYFEMADALRSGTGLEGTIEFYPEEGKYHLDGHRKCGVRFEPEQSRAHDRTCPECGKPLTIGVLHRVAELADRPAGYRPPGAPGFTNLVQLPQIVGEIAGVGRKSKKVTAQTDRLVAELGPELGILREIPLDDIGRAGGSPLAEAIARLRRGEVRREAGYDGEYGTVSLFGLGELSSGSALFDMARTSRPGKSTPLHSKRHPRANSGPGGDEPAGDEWPGLPVMDEGDFPAAAGDALSALDPDQQAAARAAGPLMVVAGPGTGKTRMLTHRIAGQIAAHGSAPGSFLAITFTRRAAEQMRARLAALLPEQAPAITVTTFHGLGLMLLHELHGPAGLAAGFTVADDAARLEVAADLAGSPRAGRRLLTQAAADPSARDLLAKALAARDLVDFDGLIERSAAVLAAEPDLALMLRRRWPRISVDEYQDMDPAQYRLLRLLAGDGTGLTVIGDPDQAIYGFRGADVGIFLRFARDYPAATTLQLARNYRSSPAIVAGALAAIAPGTLVPGRSLAAGPPLSASARASAGPRAATGPAIGFHQAADQHAEAAWIARCIDRLLGGSSFHSLDSGRADAHGHQGLGLSGIAVLYRTDAQAGPLGRAMTRAGLPFQKGSHDLLERRTGVPEIMREMRLAADPSAGPTVAGQLRAAVRRLAARAAWSGPGTGGPGTGGPGTGGLGTGRLGTGAGTALDVRAAGEILAPLARRCGEDMERFRTEISLGAAADALDSRADAITLLTLHAAKGLEFDVVFLAGCEKDLLPLWLPGADAASAPDEAEERRLLFVGMTRARERLFLTCAARRARHRTTRDTGPSPFLAAIDPGLLGLAPSGLGPSGLGPSGRSGQLDGSGQPRRDRPAERQLRLL